MSNIVPFEFEGAAVRTVKVDGDPWFLAADVCQVLEVGNSRQALARLDGDEKGVISSDTPGGAQKAAIINESGLYSLVLTSRKPSAKRFKKWVTAEVIPAIRKTGAYGVSPSPANMTRLQLIELAMQAEKERLQLEHKVGVLEPKAAFYDKFANADGLFTLQNAARVLGQRPNKFIGRLKAGYLFYQGAALVPKVQYSKMGIFEVKTGLIDDKARHQTFVTPRGLQYLSKKLGLGLLQPELQLEGGGL